MSEPENQTNKTCCVPSRTRGTGAAVSQNFEQSRPTELAETVEIPGRTGWIGTDQPKLPIDGEAPFRKIKIKPFHMDATTVTNSRFAEFVDATGYVSEAEKLGDSFVFKGFLAGEALKARAVPGTPWWRIVEGANWRTIFGPGSEGEAHPDHPVVHTSWNDAKAFAKWAGGRLPTEAEWEHAARGGQGDVKFPWGEAEPNDTDNFPCNIWQGHFPDENLCGDGYMGTAPARSFEPNSYGLYNMVGNVWEWTSQAFRVKTLKKAVLRKHSGKAGFKTIKGGSFLCHPDYCYRYRIAARSATSPDSSMSHHGFRLVYDAV